MIPYSEKFNTIGIVLIYNNKFIWVKIKNKIFIMSIDGNCVLSTDINDDKLEIFLETNKVYKLKIRW